MPDALPVRVAAFYQYARFPDCAALRAPLLAACARGGVKGSILLAPEGINATVAGSARALADMIAHVRTLPGCGAIEVKYATAAVMPFDRMKVRLKREIVTMGRPDVDPSAGVGEYIAPEDWNAVLADPATVLIDARNAYEVRIGSFAGAIDPGTRSFGDFPDWLRSRRADLMGKRVAMFCTGGIRCEKATALAKAEGIVDVMHLKGGILAYLAAVPAAASRWRGECFVFDQRVAVGHGLAPGSHSLCPRCGDPVRAAAATICLRCETATAK